MSVAVQPRARSASRRELDPRMAAAARVIGPALVLVVGQALWYRDGFASPGIYLYGTITGLLGALVAIGMALIYRANRILNFAQGELGLVPTVLAVDLIAYSSLPFLAGAAIGAAGAVLVGVLVEVLIVRRFVRAPRLILTVATIGIAQLLTVASLAIPLIWGQDPLSQPPLNPISFSFELSPITFGGSHVLALVVAPIALVAIGVFLRWTSAGVAIRAAAERSERTATLGVPVKRLNTVVWAIAALLSFTGVFLRAGMLGLPFTSSTDGFGAISFSAALAALTALALGRFTNLAAVAVSAVALGIVEQQVIFHSGGDALVYPVLGAIIFLALLAPAGWGLVCRVLHLRRSNRSRTELDDVSSWQSVDDIRPIPRELRRVPEVAVAKWGGLALLAFVLWRLPNLGFMDQSALLKASGVVIFAIIGISIIVLTGWAGQVSLGQMGFVAVGAAVGAVVTKQWHLDLSIALLIAGVAGAAVAVVVGLPALRVRGLILAATTLAFATTAAYYLLNPRFMSWIPISGIERPPLFGRVDIDSQGSYYYVCVVVLVLVLLAVGGLRASRTGRSLVALRENERAAQAYGISVTRAKLMGFALSGFFAAVAGCLYVHLLRTYTVSSFGAGESFNVFTSTVVGGLGGQLGAILGAIFSRGGTWYLTGAWQFLPSAVGVLVVLLVLPGGFSGLVYRLRDLWLRSVARRFGIAVPSLLADGPDEVDHHAVEDAEHAVEATDGAADGGDDAATVVVAAAGPDGDGGTDAPDGGPPDGGPPGERTTTVQAGERP